ncbi:DUF4491 family protein [Anaerovorax odorimutans]|uniref:DUF4491 family protein n=1 Tax=Anaerovorax odorimutans TaxID=109327 RepID=UPI0003FBD2E0|nr:DUF4491 family protein [Anaerovorax odorimutans]
MNFTGIIIGIISFIIIGIFHPIVIKCEYYFSDKIWPAFLILGLISISASFFVHNTIVTTVLGVLGCVLLWSIFELKEQKERVRKGWFPCNPNRNKKNNHKQGI